MSNPIIDQKQIEKIAELSSLELTVEETQLFARQFADILNYFKMIDEAPQMPPHDHSVDAAEHWREDEVVESPVTAESFSPHLESGHFKVPKIIE